MTKIKNYKEFKKLILNYNWYIFDDTLKEFAEKTWNFNTLENSLFILLWNARDRILKEKRHIEQAKVLKKFWYKPYQIQKQGKKQVYLAEYKGEYYKVKKIIFDNLK